MMVINKRQVKNQGMSLLEVLVAMLLLALGFLSMIGLQASSMQYSKMAYYRGIASQISSGLASSIRANRDGLTFYTSSNVYNPKEAVTEQKCLGRSNCTASQIAVDDMAWALFSAKTQLPGGYLYVVPAADAVDVMLMWQDPDSKGDLNLTCPAEVKTGSYENVQCLKARVVL